VTKVRLDTLLSRRGVFPSRTRAAASVLAGEVWLGADRRPAEKPGQLVGVDVEVSVAQAPAFVSRGGR
jgi:23S rRNA (cytidine1920-2'-O)/16S rRNA (cytidine1409-2'-O)-methyltransferase